MKLKDWADKTGIKYLTAYRWFRAGTLPVKAYQTDSGTIIIEDESVFQEQVMVNSQSNDVMSMVLKKTVDFSKNNGTVEDFAAWVLSTFSLKLNGGIDSPRYSRQKPKSEEVQKHFEQFLKPKGEKPKPSMFVASPEVIEKIAETGAWASLSEEEIHKNAVKVDTSKIDIVNATDVPGLNESINDLFYQPNNFLSNNLSSTEGGITRSTELEGLQFCTTNTIQSISNNSLIPTSTVSNCSFFDDSGTLSSFNSKISSGIATFGPTQKELQSSAKIMEIVEKPRRGRKPSKSFRRSE
jgi:hypothetical protein